ncbi:MMPL family transporter [Nocardia acidivorans]|uniref:MMPL family transporter n=1 Tax=Nocardia acidivorans TaxID=404580 RepID=UPI0008311435|nr:MMPL family transporter [Nocardia acidivorans]
MTVDTKSAPSDRIGRLTRIPAGKRGKWIVLVVWLIALVALGGFAGKLTGAEKNDSVEWLPGKAEATQAYRLADKFGTANEAPVVFVYERKGGVTEADKAAVAADVAEFKTLDHVVGDRVFGPIVAKDGEALQVLVPIDMGANGWDTLAEVVKTMRDKAGPHPDGLSAYATGPAGFAAQMGEAFKGIDGVLLFAAAGVVIVILLITYGPILWVLPLLTAGFAMTVAQSLVYGATTVGLTVNAQGAAFLTVLVFGAGTDYALLLIARYREELRRHEDRHEAMAVALRRACPAIVASGATVTIAMLVLLIAEMNSIRGFGPVCAIAILVALLAQLTLLPALLVIVGRWAFWPRHPEFGSADHAEAGIWARIGRAVAARPRTVWVITVLALVAAAFGMTGLSSNGIASTDTFTKANDASTGMEVLARHFDMGTGSPIVVIATADKADAVGRTFAETPGVTGVSAPIVKDGLVKFEATPTDAPDSAAAEATVDRVRDAVHAIDGADAKVGGQTAITLDTKRASIHDRNLIVPVTLLIVMAILMLLLRSVLAPVLLTLTVVLSFFAALGISSLIFHALGFKGSDPSLPLLTFVFLVALGIDYNIFLMSRVHEEAKKHGTRAGALIALTATGGVITSAGLVLAGTFAVFTTLPIVTFAEIGIVIAVGVLIDTLIVRSVLVTALNLDIGDRIWWPSKLASGRARPDSERDHSMAG